MLEPGESRRVTFELTPRDISYWDSDRHAWMMPRGLYRVMLGTSSRDIARSSAFYVKHSTTLPRHGRRG